jgi:hypothetical protein
MIRDVFPQARITGYFEWYYDPESADARFDTREPLSESRRANMRLRNTVIVNDLLTCDTCIAPTRWQHRQFPQQLSNKFRVMTRTAVCS